MTEMTDATEITMKLIPELTPGLNTEVSSKKQKPFLLWGLALLGSIFGGMTLKSAYLVLFTTGEFYEAAGNFVPFVVKFNGSAGFLYLIAGFGLFRQAKWAARLAALIALSTLTVYGLFWLHVAKGGPYEMQTVVAMPIRFGLWSLIAGVSWMKLLRNKTSD